MPFFPRWLSFKSSSSPQSYERELAQIAQKINQNQQRVYTYSIRQRKVTGLFTLYSILVYLAYLVLIVFTYSTQGARAVSLPQAGTVVIAPLGIYLVRKIFTWYFTRATSGVNERIKVLQTEQKEKIEELKQSTNFYSTKALLERFDSSFDAKQQQELQQQKRPGPRSRVASSSTIKNAIPPGKVPAARSPPSSATPSDGNKRSSFVAPDFEFSPNLQSLKSAPGQTGPDSVPIRPPQSLGVPSSTTLDAVHNIAYQPKWYDRILDVIVGEDEYSPKSRYALICEKCRNHNGLAQPGELPQYVVYICPHCGTRNGHEKKKRSVSAKIAEQGVDGHHKGSTTQLSGDGTPSEKPAPLKFDTSGFEEHDNNDDSLSDGYGEESKAANNEGSEIAETSVPSTPRHSKHKKRLSTSVAASLKLEDAAEAAQKATGSSFESQPRLRK